MAEAIVVMTVLLVFLGMILWVHRAYAAKIDQSANTRSDVLFYASHNCETAPEVEEPAHAPAVTTEGEAVGVDGEDPATAEKLAEDFHGKSGAKVSATGLKRNWNVVSAMREQDVDGSAIVNLEKKKMTTHVKTQSWVACNEKNYGGDWTDVAEFMWDIKDNAAGLLGK